MALIDTRELYAGRRVAWRSTMSVYYGEIQHVNEDPLRVTVLWDDMPSAPTTYEEQRMVPYLRVLCAHCGYTLEQYHDPMNKCLFGPGTWA